MKRARMGLLMLCWFAGAMPGQAVDGVASASHKTNSVKRGCDQKLSTRWDTGEPQVAGMWYQLDLKKVIRVEGVFLDAGTSVNDWPAGYSVTISTNGTEWTTVASATAAEVASTQVNGDVHISFTPVAVQYARITIAESTKSRYWAIHEMVVNPEGNDAPKIVSQIPYVPTSVSIGAQYTYVIKAHDDDADQLTHRVPVKPSWLTLSGTTLLGTPSSGDVGTHAVTVVVSDGLIETPQHFFITVRGPGNNPIIETPFTADPSIHRWSDGKFYIYGSHDKENAGVWDMEDYHVFSSTNMVDWTDHGMVLHNSQTPWGGPFWAPDAAERNGMYYLYFPEGQNLAVATSTSPTGPFTNPVSIYTTTHNKDPNVFFDGGRWHVLINDGFPNLLTLKDNMVEIDYTTPLVLEPGGNFHEGPWMYIANGYYYLTCGGYNSIRYWMATNLLGPYTFKGDLLVGTPEFPIYKTAHGSIIDVDGQLYLAYHVDVDGPYERTSCIDYLFTNPDGSLRMVIPTLKGIEPVIPGRRPKVSPPPSPEIPGILHAQYYSAMSGIQLHICTDVGAMQYVGNISSGKWMSYDVNVTRSGEYIVSFRVAGTSNPRFDLKQGSNILCSVNAPATGGMQTWTTVTNRVTLSAGTNTLNVFATGAGWTINWMEFLLAED